MIRRAIAVALGCQSRAHQVETKVKALCAKQQMHSDSLKYCQVGIKGVLLHCPDPMSHRKEMAAGL